MLECWNAGMLECWNAGELEHGGEVMEHAMVEAAISFREEKLYTV